MYPIKMPKNNSTKRVKIFISTLFLWSCLSSNSNITLASNSYKNTTRSINEQHNEYRGIVGDLDSYSFILPKSESLLIEVTQTNADLKLVLFNIDGSTKSTPVFEASIPARDWISERILVNSSQCTSCLLQIHPIESADQSGNYQLTSRRLDTKSHAQEIAFETIMTTASNQWSIADKYASENVHFLTQASDLYLKAAKLTDYFHSEEAKQRSLYLAAKVFHLLGNYQAQEKLLLRVNNINKNPNSHYRLRATFALGSIAQGRKQLTKATLQFQNALELAKLQNDELMQARTTASMGSIASANGDYQKAVSYFEKAYQVFLAHGDWRSTIEGLIAIGWFNYKQGNTDLALNYYHQALSFATKTQLPGLKTDALTKIGASYRRIGNIDQANHYIDQALVNSHKFSHSLLDGWAKQEKARVLLDTGMFELAQDVFEEAQQAYSKVNSISDKINIDYFLGIAHYKLGNYAIAEEYYQRVLEFDKKTAIDYDIGAGYNRLAEISLEQKNYTKALAYQQQALQHLKSLDDIPLKGRAYSQAALVYFYNGMQNEAENYFLRAKNIMTKNKDYFELINLDYRIAITQASKGKKKQALETLSTIIQQVQSQYESITRDDIRRSYLALQQKITGLQIGLMRDTNASTSETLKVSEMFRSKTLNERLSNIENLKTEAPEISKQRLTLQRKLQSHIINYHQLANPTNRNGIIKETRKLASQLAQLEATVKINNKISEIKKAEPIDIKKIQKQLSPQVLILYFDTNAPDSYLWTITNSDIHLFTLPSNEILSEQIADVLKLVKESPENSRFNRKSQQRNAIKLLSNTLFANKNIAWENFRSIIVIPDGPINYLPLSILTLPKQKRPLVERIQVTYAPSLSVLENLSKRDQDQKKLNNLLLIANPMMTKEGKSNVNIAKLRGGFENSELPYTRKEAKSIIKVAGDRVSLLNREKANKKALFSTTLNRFNILHFATHGLANSHVPSLGGLVLSNASADNNLLLAPEIINLNINAELVVLSGCETALGRLIDGEGLQGLSRAFFEAGAKRVIASLWSVQDDATAELMGAFYRFLLEDKKRPGEALRLAKLHVKNYQRKNHRKPWKDPFYWAGFVLQGMEESWID